MKFRVFCIASCFVRLLVNAYDMNKVLELQQGTAIGRLTIEVKPQDREADEQSRFLDAELATPAVEKEIPHSLSDILDIAEERQEKQLAQLADPHASMEVNPSVIKYHTDW